MPVTLEQILNEMPEERRANILRRTQEIREELDLREVRKLRKLTQTRLSRKLKIGQEGVSRIEKRSDLYISTLRSYVEAVGGKLKLVVELPDRAPILLTGLGGDVAEKKAREKPRTDSKTNSKSHRAA
jgi:DNA-binding XRE family transcriptional regulator